MHYYPTLQCRSLQSRRRSHTLLWTCWGRVWGRCGVYQSCLLSHFDGSQNSPFLQLLRVLMPSGDSENMGRQRKSGSIHKNKNSSTPSRPGLLTNPLSLNCQKPTSAVKCALTVRQGGKEGCSHLKCFAEHVFPFFTPQEVDDHLFAIQPPQRCEMSGQQTQIIRLIVLRGITMHSFGT